MLALQQLCECCASWVLFSAVFVVPVRILSPFSPHTPPRRSLCGGALVTNEAHSLLFLLLPRREGGGERDGGWLVG